MKFYALLFGLMFSFSSLSSQNFLLLENGTSCDLHVQLYSQVSGSCAFGSYANYVVASGASIPATAPAGEEWVYSEIIPWPYINTPCSFGQALGTDGFPSCVSCPGWGAPTSAVVFPSNCTSCPSAIKMLWTAYCGSGPGHIHFY